MSKVILRDLHEDDLPALLAIHNEAVANSTAIWSVQPATLENRRMFVEARRKAGFPFIAAERAGQLAGYGSFGEFRAWDGYLHTVEHSIYCRTDCRGQGMGGMLLDRLIEEARKLGKHVMIGGIEAANTASMALHAGRGFVETGRLREVGRKFDRWLDLVFMQKIL
jgi:L-amino acid N-acyltransferase YncA